MGNGQCVIGFNGFVIAVVSASMLIAANRSMPTFSGTWRGTFNSQPAVRGPVGSFAEEVNRFQITLRQHGVDVMGEFRRLESAESVPIKNGKLFGDRACLDVVSGGENMRWCVSIDGGKLRGLWNRGPEGGPLTNGMGMGARLFDIVAERIRTKTGGKAH